MLPKLTAFFNKMADKRAVCAHFCVHEYLDIFVLLFKKIEFFDFLS
ncbi:hypothetical protein BAOM_1523 [Peribacillus asahii]|uniref:Uncharacterized protein n=1 Tax=Peribacillus asahii TaxID=228899 RepID=A0A3T0KPB0_9BACI|nr:hypothetical protein BAOM_1523 [Peribacillus asahii]